MIMQTQIDNSTTVQRFVLWLCCELSIKPDSISVYGEDHIDGGVNGLCMDDSPSDFVILVKTKNRTVTDVFNTIAHEMIHVKQYMKENLGHWLDTCQDIPYMERWWEVEAFSNSFGFVERFVNEFYNKPHDSNQVEELM